jgi:hypothetical protein
MEVAENQLKIGYVKLTLKTPFPNSKTCLISFNIIHYKFVNDCTNMLFFNIIQV